MATVVPNGVQMELLWASFQGQSMLNRLWFIVDGGVDSTTLLEMLGATESAVTGNLTPVMASGVSSIGARIRDVSAASWGTPIQQLWESPHAGSLSSESEPFFSCGVVRFLGDAGADVPENYVRHTGLAESQCIGNRMTTSAANDIGAAWDGFVGDIVAATTATIAQVNASLFSGFTLVTKPNGTVVKAPTPRTTALVSPVSLRVCSQVLGRAVSRAGSGA